VVRIHVLPRFNKTHNAPSGGLMLPAEQLPVLNSDFNTAM
jgi:hypothetical protein